MTPKHSRHTQQQRCFSTKFLTHLTPNYIKHTYSHLVENFYVHNTKSIDTTQVKRKCGRPPKAKLENSNSNLKCTTAAITHTAQPHQIIKNLSNDIASRELVKSTWNTKSQTG